MAGIRNFFWTVIVLLALPANGFAAPSGGYAASPQKNGSGIVTVRQTVDATLKYNNSLKAIQENRQAVLHELRRAKAGYGPRLDVVGNLGASRLSNTTTRPLNADRDMYGDQRIGLTLTQPLWDGFATRSRVATEEATADSMTSRVLDNANSLGLDGIIAHIDVLRQREILRLAAKNVENHRKTLGLAQDRVKMGADTMADITQTQGRLTRAEATLVEATASLRNAETVYRRMTGKTVPTSLETVTMLSPSYANAAAVFAEAEKYNPKIKAYMSDIKAAAGERELSKSAFHPVINLEAGPQYANHHGPGEQWTSEFSVMGTMRWNIFNSGADVAAVKAAGARVRKSRQELFDLVDELRKEIENSWTGYKSALEQAGFYEEAVSYNTQTRDSYMEQFLVGQRTLLDVLDAESELFNSSTQAVTARCNVLVGNYRLHALSGELLPRLGFDVANLNIPPAGEPAEDAR